MNNKNFKNRSSLISSDSTFNRLRELQVLLKKESALKELCKNKNYIIKKFVFSYQNKRRDKKTNQSRMY